MENCKPINTSFALGEKLCSNEDFQKVDKKNYCILVGCLLYLTATRPDIMFTIGLLSRFIHYCDTFHLKATKRVMNMSKEQSILGYVTQRRTS